KCMPDDERLFLGVTFRSRVTPLAASARRGRLAIDARVTADKRKAAMNRRTPNFVRAKPALGRSLDRRVEGARLENVNLECGNSFPLCVRPRKCMPDDERLFLGVSFRSRVTPLAASARRGRLAIDARVTADKRKAAMNRRTPNFVRAKPALG